METKGKKKFVGKSGKASRGKVPHGKRKFKRDNGKEAKLPDRSPGRVIIVMQGHAELRVLSWVNLGG